MSGVIRKVGDGEIGVAGVVNDLKREGVIMSAGDGNRGTATKVGGDVGRSRGEFASDGSIKYSDDK